jgi:hypothetical protein
VSSPSSKNIPLPSSGKSPLQARPILSPWRGVGHRHERWDGMRWTRQRRRALMSQGGFWPKSDRHARDEWRHARRSLLAKTGAAYGKIVWSRHPLLVPSCRWRDRSNRIRSNHQAGSDGDKTNSSPRRARHKPSNHCAGKAGVFPLNLYARVRFYSCILHTRPRVQRAPGFPCAL